MQQNQVVNKAFLTKEDFNGSRRYQYAAVGRRPRKKKAESIYFELFRQIARDQAEWLGGAR